MTWRDETLLCHIHQPIFQTCNIVKHSHNLYTCLRWKKADYKRSLAELWVFLWEAYEGATELTTVLFALQESLDRVLFYSPSTSSQTRHCPDALNQSFPAGSWHVFFPWHGSCVSEGQIDFILDVFLMFCPSHQLLVNKFVTDFGRSKRPPPLHQVVSKPSGGTLATTVTAAREWSMGVRPGVETGQMRSPPKKNTEKGCGEKYLFLPPQKIRSRFKLVEVWFMTLHMCFCWGLIWHLEWCWRRQPFLHALPGKRTAQVYLLTSLNFIPKTAPLTGKMSKIDSKVVGFREAEGSFFWITICWS